MLRAREMSFWDKLYIPAIIKGMIITLKHLPKRKFTMQYPEEKWEYPPRFRGIHKLTKDEKERVKCVACFMCATACPAQCINIKAQASSWPDREKIPEVFEIDLLRCIFCGYCVEACPEDAIVMTNKPVPSMGKRQDFIINKEQLLNN